MDGRVRRRVERYTQGMQRTRISKTIWRRTWNCNRIVGGCDRSVAALGMVAALLTMGTSFQAVAQEIDVAPRMNVGDVWRFSVALDVLVSEQAEETTEAGRIVQSAHVRLEAIRAEEDGAVVVRGDFDRMTSVWRRGNDQLEFSWSRPAGDAPIEAPDFDDEAIAAMTDVERFSAMYASIAAQSFELRIGPSGEILGVAGLTDGLRFMTANAGLNSAALGMFVPPRFAEALGPIWTASGAAAIEGVGDEWTEQREIGLGGAGELRIIADWTANRLRQDGRLECEGDVNVSIQLPDRPSETQPTVEVLRGVGDVEMTWSTADQTLVERAENLELTTSWVIGDIRMTMIQVSSRRLARLSAGD